MTSRPSRATGMAPAWMGVADSKPISAMVRRSASPRSRVSKPTGSGVMVAAAPSTALCAGRGLATCGLLNRMRDVERKTVLSVTDDWQYPMAPPSRALRKIWPMTAEVLCTLDLPDPFPGMVSAAASLRSLGRLPGHDELCAELRERPVDVLCPQLRDPIDAAVMDAGLPRLRCVSAYAVGYDNIDVDAATARGIVVGHTPGVLTDAVADCTMGLILAAGRRLCEGDREVRAGRYHGWEPTYLLGLELRDALLGLVGFGRIGQAVARRALAFSMRIAYFDTTNPVIADDLRSQVTSMPFDELLRESDVI